MRTVDEYLRDLLNKRSNNQQYNDNEKERILTCMTYLINGNKSTIQIVG